MNAAVQKEKPNELGSSFEISMHVFLRMTSREKMWLLDKVILIS